MNLDLIKEMHFNNNRNLTASSFKTLCQNISTSNVFEMNVRPLGKSHRFTTLLLLYLTISRIIRPDLLIKAIRTDGSYPLIEKLCLEQVIDIMVAKILNQRRVYWIII